jgi:hypothetical protein
VELIKDHPLRDEAKDLLLFKVSCSKLMVGMLKLIKAPRLGRRPRGYEDRLPALQGGSQLIEVICGLLIWIP